MKVIARINADGSLLIKGEVFELLPSWNDAQEIDEEFTIDEDTEVDEELPFEDFMEILLGIQSQLENVDRLYFDKDGNLFTSEVIEDLIVQLNKQKEIKVNEIVEGVDL